jgi:hypothetical protein
MHCGLVDVVTRLPTSILSWTKKKVSQQTKTAHEKKYKRENLENQKLGAKYYVKGVLRGISTVISGKRPYLC